METNQQDSTSTALLSDRDSQQDGDSDGEEVKYVVYKKRWLVLFIVTFLGFSSDMIWMSFSPAATIMADYYNVSINEINVVSLAHMILPIGFSFVASWLLDSYGLRPSLLIGSWVALIGSVLRVISTMHFMPSSWRFPVVLTGQAIAATVAPIFNVCTTKVSEQWFGPKQRSLSTMVVSASYGITLANLITPIIIKYKGVQFMFILYAGFPLFGALITTFGMTSSKPPTPPSPSAAAGVQPFWPGVKQILKNRQFIILMLLVGLESGLFDALSVVAEEMMCTHGYEPTFSGLVMGVQSGVGVFGALFASLYVDRTKLFEETLKVLYCLSSTSVALMMTVSCIPHMQAPILITNIAYGIFSSAAYPIALELSVETSYPVAEGTSNGLILMFIHLEGVIFTFILEALSQPMTNYERIHQKCNPTTPHHQGSNVTSGYHGYNNSYGIHGYYDSSTYHPSRFYNSVTKTNVSEPKDMTVAMMVFAGLECFQAIALTLFFKSGNRRLKAEETMEPAEGESSVNA
ncbi:solute carrier family 49 member A3-like [Ptychodera flava]|uniref:solute carrier family 49 member A3-like n=1 Tax=Ptychodera flava TaxID=63121 RepID=UPI00396A354F